MCCVCVYLEYSLRIVIKSTELLWSLCIVIILYHCLIANHICMEHHRLHHFTCQENPRCGSLSCSPGKNIYEIWDSLGQQIILHTKYLRSQEGWSSWMIFINWPEASQIQRVCLAIIIIKHPTLITTFNA